MEIVLAELAEFKCTFLDGLIIAEYVINVLVGEDTTNVNGLGYCDIDHIDRQPLRCNLL